jgi:hypothetical protein
LHIETLETRSLLAPIPGLQAAPPRLEVESNDTLDAALSLGSLSALHRIEVLGTIGHTSARSADVDWYRFTLEAPASVTLAAKTPKGTAIFPGIVSLYNDDPGDWEDIYDPTGHRLLAQYQGTAQGGGGLTRRLAPGTYYVAVSGAGNRFFHPFLAGSGYSGQTGPYNLVLTAADLVLVPSQPIVLAVDASPLVLRLDLHAPVAPEASLTLSDSTGALVPLAWSHISTAVLELQLAPARALLAGTYTVSATDDTGQTVFSATVDVPVNISTEAACSVADDTPAGAHTLGDITRSGLVQVQGTIGDDLYYDRSCPDLPVNNPGNDVDLYHFHISGTIPQVLTAEVFAGRIGSFLSAGLGLFRFDPGDQQLHFVDGNKNTLNPSLATDGSTPLAFDPVLHVLLTEGDYYLAVSSDLNTPSPAEGLVPGPDSGIFDPNISHSGLNGFTTGPYVLNLAVSPAPNPPRVAATNIAEGASLSQPPTHVVVQFTAPINLQQLAFRAYMQLTPDDQSPVYILGSDGSRYFPRLESYERGTNQASFLMLDGLNSGAYELHLSGPLGLQDFAGNALVDNDPGGDYVVPFVVEPERWINGEARLIVTEPGHHTLDTAQPLGVMFPYELQAVITLQRDSASMPPDSVDTEDYFSFQVLQRQIYCFDLHQTATLAGVEMTLTDQQGNTVPFGTTLNHQIVSADLEPGVYVLRVGTWPASAATTLRYTIKMTLQGVGDNPPPLLNGPEPAIAIRFDSIPQPTPPAGPSLPASGGSASNSTSGSGSEIAGRGQLLVGSLTQALAGLMVGTTFQSLNTTGTASSGNPSASPLAVPPPGVLLALREQPMGSRVEEENATPENNLDASLAQQPSVFRSILATEGRAVMDLARAVVGVQKSLVRLAQPMEAVVADLWSASLQRDAMLPPAGAPMLLTLAREESGAPPVRALWDGTETMEEEVITRFEGQQSWKAMAPWITAPAAALAAAGTFAQSRRRWRSTAVR